ncbi:GlsB/YeaQ/YmgE family stress response membrane protein [Novosphingobium sp. Chol11]|uniref:GlsB/YeaQ/YmgE family stress response membrane protein n=1 Tax=Novosphingobium sp. Chol11 TaxID=1385763 RepID=UPI0025F8E67C|nr:GlsB/YeaQ/YmgE family stress response membrane protein [Novosphingobium sp. Chol11]
MFNLISIVLSGLIVGFAARFFYPGEIEMGLGRTILLGIGGALVAGLAASWSGKRSFGEGVNRAGCIASVLGAMLLIFIGRNL